MNRLAISWLFFAVGATSGPALAREVAEADVSVASVEAQLDDEEFHCRMAVANKGDDDSRATVLQVLLPVETNFRSYAIEEVNPAEPEEAKWCAPGPLLKVGSKSTRTFVTCYLGHLGVHRPPDASRLAHVTVTSDAPPSDLSVRYQTCGAFVWSNMPDPAPANNHGSASAAEQRPR